jgi:hypothetical protein
MEKLDCSLERLASKDSLANMKQNSRDWWPDTSDSLDCTTATTVSKKSSASSSVTLGCMVTSVSNAEMSGSKSYWSGCKMDLSVNTRDWQMIQDYSWGCLVNKKVTLMVSVPCKVTFHQASLEIQDSVTNSETCQKHQIVLMARNLDLLESFH